MVGRALRACVGVALLAASCSGTSETATEPGATPATVVHPAPLLPATTDDLPTMSAPTYATLLGQLRGTPLIVNFWASWCAPCIEEAPLLRAAADEYADRIQFLGVNILDARSDAEAFIQEQELPYPSIFDPAGAIRDSVGSTGQPVTVFYRADGEVAVKIDGQLSAGTLQDAIAEIVR